MRKQKRK